MNFKELVEKTLKDKKKQMIIGVCVIGVMLILLSQFSNSDAKSRGNPETVTTQETTLKEYTGELESKIHSLVTNISGVGEAKVLITFKNDTEYVYVNEEKKNIDKSENVANNNEKTTEEKENVEQTLIIMKGDDGEQALLKTKIEPTVKGVVVVCTGGDIPSVQQAVSEAVTTALDIGYNDICVTKLV